MSGKASVEEIFTPGKASPVVVDRADQLTLQRQINEPLQAVVKAGKDFIREVFASAVSTAKAIPNLGGVTMTMNVDASSFTNANIGSLSNYLCLSLKALSLAAKSELSTFFQNSDA